MFTPCSPTWSRQPTITSSTSAGSIPARATTSPSTSASRSAGCHPASIPLRRPIGVRTASTMNASRLMTRPARRGPRTAEGASRRRRPSPRAGPASRTRARTPSSSRAKGLGDSPPSARLQSRLAAATAPAGPRGDLRGERDGRVEQLLLRVDLRHEAGAQGLVGLHQPAGQDQVLREADRGGAGEPLGAAPPRDDPEGDLGLARSGPCRRPGGRRRRARSHNRPRGRSR